MSALQAIFFDFDGVLLDTEPVHWACWAEMLASVGLTLTWEDYRDHCIGIDDRDMLRTMAQAGRSAARLGQPVGALSGQETTVSGADDGAAVRSSPWPECCPTCIAGSSWRWSVPVRPARSSRCWCPAASGSISTPSSAAAT